MNNSSTMGVVGRVHASRRTSMLAAVALTALLLLALALRGLAGGPMHGAPTVPLRLAAAAPSSSHVSVQIQNYAFSPAALTVSAGTTVTWTNDDTAPHTVTVSSGPVTFSSPQLQKGQSFSYTFTKVGGYKYYCAVHPDMIATVQVVAAAAAAPTTAAPAPATTSAAAPAKHATHKSKHKKKHKKHTTVAPAPAPAPAAVPAAPAPSSEPTMDMGSSATCDGAFAALNLFLQHVYAGHLSESPSQQVADITNIDQYVKTHTVLVSGILGDLIPGVESALDQLIMHIDAGHLGESPAQQVADITNADQYVKTHTVLVSNMLQALLGAC